MVAGRTLTRTGASVTSLLAGAALVVGPACVRLDAQDAPQADPPAPRADARARAELARETEQLEGLSRAFRQVAALARPSVVSIDVQGPATARHIPGDDLLRRFFGDAPLSEGDEEVSSGTGVILAADGVVLTNDHVLGPPSGDVTVQVTLHDGRSYQARVRGRDARSDLALLALEAPPDDLVPAVLGDSDAVDVGDWVVAIGSPFGLQQTVTTGIVSAKSRANVGITEYEDFIQTDAALNPGSSGGPLLNLRGEVIGINTAIASGTGGFMGVGFAIPSDMAREVAAQLGEAGRVVRGWLGVALRSLTDPERRALNLGERAGVLVFAITPDGPAASAGLAPGDVVLTLGGEPARDPTRLRHLIARAPVGEPIELEVWRDGAARTVEVIPAELTREAQARASTSERRRTSSR